MRNRFASILVPGLALGLLVACGGGSNVAPQATTTPMPPATPAASLVYTDPDTTGWRLVKDNSSTSKRLVLNLVGPVGIRSRGVGFNLKAGAGVTFGLFSNQWHAKDTGVFDLLNRHRSDMFPPDEPEPTFFGAGVKPGNLLTVGIFQKDRLVDAKVVSSPVLQIAVELPATSTLSAGDQVTLSVTKAKMVPEDLGTMTQDGWYNETELMAKGKPQDIQIAVGALKGL